MRLLRRHLPGGHPFVLEFARKDAAVPRRQRRETTICALRSDCGRVPKSSRERASATDYPMATNGAGAPESEAATSRGFPHIF